MSKICDQISDAILDELLRQDPNSRVAVECLVTTGTVIVAGEVTSKGYADVQKIARNTLREIGYTNPLFGIDADDAGVLASIHNQSPDIAMGVDESEEKDQGAGDQGMMYGFACNETPELMPLPIILAHRLSMRLAECRKKKIIECLGPDGKTQVTVEYDGFRPRRIDAIVIAQQHTDDKPEEHLKKEIIEHVINPVCGYMMDEWTNVHVNATGKFVIGGPEGDTGLTGRKIIVDTYGGIGRHGGGCFCLTGDSLINTELGLLTLNSMNGITENLLVKTDVSPTKAEMWLDNGQMETIKVITKDGFGIEGTKNQCIRVVDENGNYLWRRLDELRDSDWVAIQKKNRLFGKGYETKVFSFRHKAGTRRKNEFRFPKVLTDDYAYLMGLLIGDGNCMMDGGISICICENEQKSNVQNLYKKLFGKHGKIFGHWAFFGGIELRKYLEYIGLKKQRSWEKEVPVSIFSAEPEVAAAFLRGLFDTNGSVTISGRNNTSLDIKLATTSPKLAGGVQQLLLNFGIITNIQIIDKAGKVSEIQGRKLTTRRKIYHIRIRGFESIKIFKEKIGFRLSRKKKTLDSVNLGKKTDMLKIPNQYQRIRRLWNKLPSSIKQKDEFKIGRFARSHKGKATKELTYDKLKTFLDGYAKFFEGDYDFEYLRTIFVMNHYYAKISKIDGSNSHVFDITVPGAHTFTANGFVCHNSGKDPSKVDRSGAYAARYVAKNIVAAGLAERCEVQISYVIGVARPVSVNVECFGTNRIPEEKISEIVLRRFLLTPKWIISHLRLKKPIYKKTAAYGHFGRSDPDFTWERTDMADILREDAGL